ncbi:ATP-grasp domain-containing protein [Microbispora sp. NPDC049125]|uniref:ATP-grasp domain-containing protein n=1 Tax=Microbispora sp. NPDC049125 TaxID=3154929 RepID=UPI003466C55A
MTRRRFLLLGTDRMEPAELLAGDPRVDLCVVTKPKHARRYGEAEVATVPDLGDITAVRDAAAGLLGDGLDAVAASNERGQLAAGFLRSFHGIQGMPFGTTVRFTRKDVMKRAIQAAGLPHVPFQVIGGLDGLSRAAKELGRPVVVKPSMGAGARGTYRLEEDSPVPGGLEKVSAPLVVERFVEAGRELHCDGVVHDGEVVFASVSQYFQPVLTVGNRFLGSFTLPPDDPAAASMRELHAAAVAALGMRAGITHMEAFDAGGELLFSEIACRPGGGGVVQAVEDRHGVNLWRAFLSCALGDPPEAAFRDGGVITGWIGLPGRNGVVRRISDAGELAAVPGVARLTMYHRPGQRVAEKPSSVFYAGLALLRVATAGEAFATQRELARRFVLEMEPDQGGAP